LINRFFVAFGLLVGAATCVSAQLAPSQPDAVAGAVTDCWAAVGRNGVDRNLLGQRGWRAGSITAPGGKRVDTPLKVYGKAGSNVVLMLLDNVASPACTVTARVGTASDISLAARAVQRQLTSADPQVKTVRSGQSIVFLALPRIAMFDATGTKAQPSIRAVVSFREGERG
jgi:hypothetical protein